MEKQTKEKEMVTKILIAKVLPFIIGQLMKELTPEKVRELMDKLFDILEDAVKDSENKFDDALLPIIASMRVVFNIPDED